MIDELEKLALQLAPELAEAGFRILEHRPDWLAPPRAVAYAIRGRHLDIRNHLRSTGEWSGAWGSYVVFIPPLPKGSDEVAMLIHELAHTLPARPPIIDDGDQPTRIQRDLQAGQVMTWAHAGRNSVEPWSGHGARWIRRACHLKYRAARLGIDVDLTAANVAGSNYGLTHPTEYDTALATEPLRMATASFGDIDAEPMPIRFAAMFARDVGQWHFDQLTQEQRT
jgi:hypothetical protein